MIKNIFPVNIVVKDYDLSEEFNIELKKSVETIFQKRLLDSGLTRDELGDTEFPLFTEENKKEFPVLNKMLEIMTEGFVELAESYNNNELDKNDILSSVQSNIGKLPFMQKGTYKKTHNHTGASAFAIFYLNDIDNDKHGGELILKDPAFHSNLGFHPPEEHGIETKKNRLIVAPGYIWHEVSPYLGDEERLSIVMNLDLKVNLQ